MGQFDKNFTHPVGHLWDGSKLVQDKPYTMMGSKLLQVQKVSRRSTHIFVDAETLVGKDTLVPAHSMENEWNMSLVESIWLKLVVMISCLILDAKCACQCVSRGSL